MQLPTGQLVPMHALLGFLFVASPTMCSAAVPSPEPQCAQPVGQVYSILFQGNPLDEVVQLDQMHVERGRERIRVSNAMFLCAGDVIITGSDTTAHVHLFEPPNDQTVTPDSASVVKGPASVFLLGGVHFFSLKGVFDVANSLGHAMAGGTEFEIRVAKEWLEVVQLSGSLSFVPTQEHAAVWPSDGFGLHTSDDEQSTLLEAGQSTYPSHSDAPQPASVQLDRLTRLSYRPGVMSRVLPAEETLVRRVLDANSQTIVVSRPLLPSKSLIPVFDSAEQRAQAFREARFATIWKPEEHRNFELLGNVYADWGEASRARGAYEQASNENRSPQESARYHNKLGDAYRLLGETKKAKKLYKNALKEDPTFALPYNGLGDVYRELAEASMDQGDRKKARERLKKAREYYQRALDPTLWGKERGTDRAIPTYHLGEAALLSAELGIAKKGGDKGRSPEDYYREARDYFGRALQVSPGYLFAQVGVARSHVSQASFHAARGERDQADRSLAEAVQGLRSLLEQNPRFAVAREQLGEALEEQGNSEAALSQFTRAVRLDPQYPMAYFKLGETLTKLGRREEAKIYYQTFLRIESPLFRGGDRFKTAEERIPPPLPPPPPPGEKVKVPKVKGDNREEAIGKISGRGLIARVEEEASCEPIGKVLQQDPRKDTKVPQGSTVTIHVAGPEERAARVPELQGRQQDTAVNEIAERGLSVGKIRQEETDREREGAVLRQNPKANTVVAHGCPVDLTVAIPPKPVQVPNLIGMTEKQARSELGSGFWRALAPLQLGSVSYEDSEATPGTVIRQDPPPGAWVPKGTAVNLVIARSPDVIGMTREEAARVIYERTGGRRKVRK